MAETAMITTLRLWKGHQYETVSGFICEAFGYIPRTDESIKIVLEKENKEENDEHTEDGSECQELNEKHQIYNMEKLSLQVVLAVVPTGRVGSFSVFFGFFRPV